MTRRVRLEFGMVSESDQHLEDGAWLRHPISTHVLTCVSRKYPSDLQAILRSIVITLYQPNELRRMENPQQFVETLIATRHVLKNDFAMQPRQISVLE